ncbi:MAG: cob(I)yrinic acid a,c-diamide adenosyltransferase [Candidatus Omnitrophica bacterium]|nr:cob(I)yrinic acid a,c-diamide adenosyltransferase [Candidatus Omnitrophota bacterium]
MIQVYTGNGKGKTTASLGLALRAIGAGKKIYIAQFCKRGQYNELKILKKLKGIKVEQFGSGCLIKEKPSKKDIESAQKGLEKVKKIIGKRKYDVIILDEINMALHFKLLRLKDMIQILKSIPKNIEVILTGRYASQKIIEIADLVSEIKEIKHYYKKGVRARKGFEF